MKKACKILFVTFFIMLSVIVVKSEAFGATSNSTSNPTYSDQDCYKKAKESAASDPHLSNIIEKNQKLFNQKYNEIVNSEYNKCVDNKKRNTNTNTNKPYDPGYNPDDVPDKLVTKSQNIWATVVTLVQIISIGCVVFTGLRYMFSSSSQKADLKKGLSYLAIGALLVFCTITIINFVVSSTRQII